jgi:peptide/nickel transport system permease protein
MPENLEKVGLAVLVIFMILALISFYLPTIDPMYQPLYGTDPEIIGYSHPSTTHLLGTDFLGRDLFSQLCKGASNAISLGIFWSIMGIPLVVLAAFIMSRLRSSTPMLEDTMLNRYVRFVAFPLCVVAFLLMSSLFLGMLLGRISYLTVIFILGLPLAFMLWLAIGHPLEIQFRNGEKISIRYLISGIFLLFSYATLYLSLMGFIGLGDPSTITWGMMIQWCFTSGYTFKAMNWLLPPIICTYVFSRGMLVFSYGIYNAQDRKWFIKKGWL